MRAWAATLAALSLAMAGASSYARSAHIPPHYYGADDAIERSQGYWRLTHETPERRVRADSVAFSCADQVGPFSVSWLSMPGEQPYCSYNQRGGPVIYVQKMPADVSVARLVEDEIRRGARSVVTDRNVGRCRGVLIRTTADPTSGRYPNGREWRTQGRHDIVYALEREGHLVSVRLRSEGPPPYYERDAEVLRIGEFTMPC